MANNPSLDRVMLEASAAAYAIIKNSDGTLTLSGSDPSQNPGQIYFPPHHSMNIT